MAHRLETLPGIDILQAGKDPDPILSVARYYEADPRPFKINAGVGVFRKNDGTIFVPDVIREARLIASNNLNTNYLAPEGEEGYLGDRTFLLGTAKLALGPDYYKYLAETDRLVLVGTVGGTSAVSVAVDALRRISKAPVIVGTATWGPHLQITEKYDVPTITVPHVGQDGKFNMEGYLKAIAEVPDHAAIILHNGKTHNPTGVNPQSKGEWEELGKAIAGKGMRVILDTPYAGFGDSMEEDMKPGRILMEQGVSVVWCVSYSKNAGLYNERVGTLITTGGNKANTRDLQNLFNYVVRSDYSSPPAFGERTVAEAIRSPKQVERFQREVDGMRKELQTRRQIMAGILDDDRMREHYGMFEIVPGFTPEHVAKLRAKHAIYTVGARVNLAGVPTENIERMSRAIRNVRRT